MVNGLKLLQRQQQPNGIQRAYVFINERGAGNDSIQLGSGEIVRNPSLKSDRDRRRHLTALQGEVSAADQTARAPGGR